MSRIAVLIPFKAQRRKSRLSRLLGEEERKRLAELMLIDVLEAAKGAGVLRRSYVISSDEEALSLSRKAGASTIREARDSGVNEALAAGMSELGTGLDFAVLPSDLPQLTPVELASALELKKAFGCVMAPSRAFDGTNLLVFSGRTPLRLSYDSDSFWNHLRTAAEMGAKLAVCTKRGVLNDVDTDDDLTTLARSDSASRSAVFARGVVHRRPS